jgi:hypothetical protein
MLIIEGINDQSNSDNEEETETISSPGKIHFDRSKITLSPKAKKSANLYHDLSGNKEHRISLPMTEERKNIYEDTPSPSKDPFEGGILRELSEKKKMEKQRKKDARNRIKEIDILM